MNISHELHQSLLELAYDLLSDDEAAALRQRIAADDALRLAWHRVEREVVRLAQAARFDVAPVSFRPPLETPSILAESLDRPSLERPSLDKPALAAPSLETRSLAMQAASLNNFHNHQPRSLSTQSPSPAQRQSSSSMPRLAVPAGGAWAVAIAAGLLLAVLLAGYVVQRGDLAALERQPARLIVTGPARLSASETNSFRVQARTMAGKPLSVDVGYAVYKSSGELLLERSVHTARDGRAQLALEPGLEVGEGARLEVFSRSADASLSDNPTRIVAELPASPVEYETQLAFDRRSYQPGETVFFRTVTLARFDFSPSQAFDVRYEVLGPEGNRLEPSNQHAVTQQGVASGSFALPQDAAPGEYTLVASAPGRGASEVRETFLVRAPHPEQPAQAPTSTDDVEVQFYPEGGDLAAGMSQRVYLTCHDSLGRPVQVEGNIVDQAGRPVAQVTTAEAGMGRFWLRPIKDQEYFLKIDQPSGVTQVKPLPPCIDERPIVLCAGSKVAGDSTDRALEDESAPGVALAGEPVELSILARRASLPLVVTVTCRGVQVGEYPLVTERGRNRVSLPLADDVAGVLRVTVHDFSRTPAQPVAERLIYRHPTRKLQLHWENADVRVSPGEPVELSLQVRDELGQPAQCMLGVSVVDRAQLDPTVEESRRITTHFLLDSSLEPGLRAEQANFVLSEAQGAAETLDLVLGTQGWRRFITRPSRDAAPSEPMLAETRSRNDVADAASDRWFDQYDAAAESSARFVSQVSAAEAPLVLDNLRQLQSDQQSRWRAARPARFEALGSVGFFGGAVLLVTLVYWAVQRRVVGKLVYATACALAVASLVVSCGMLSRGPTRHMGTQVAFQSTRPNAQESDQPLGAVARVEETLDQRAPSAEPRDRTRTLLTVHQAAWKKELLGAPREDESLAAVLGTQHNSWLELARLEDLESRLKGDLKHLDPQTQAATHYFADMIVDQTYRNADASWDLNGTDGIPGDRYERFGADAEMRGWRTRVSRTTALDFKESTDGSLSPAGADPGKSTETLREYAHAYHRITTANGEDLSPTLCWKPLMETDAAGRATVTFESSDAITTFRLLAEAHGAGARLGAVTADFASTLPWSIEPKLPLVLNAGDHVDLQVATVNESRQELPMVLNFQPPMLFSAVSDLNQPLALPANGRMSNFFSFDVVGRQGAGVVQLAGTNGLWVDQLEQVVQVESSGFPVEYAASGTLSADRDVSVHLPTDVLPGTLAARLVLLPSLVANLETGLSSLAAEPEVGLERVIATSELSMLVLDALGKDRQPHPHLSRIANEHLATAFDRLSPYECARGGFNWLARGEGEVAPSARALVVLRELSRLRLADQASVERTRDWLLARRYRSGRATGLPGAAQLATDNSEPIVRAYILWNRLSTLDATGPARELPQLADAARQSVDPYLIALVADSATHVGQTRRARSLLTRLAGLQAADGHLAAHRSSIMPAQGSATDAEATALAALAWLHSGEFQAQAKGAIQWLLEHRQASGSFGSCRATVLALRALVEQAGAHPETSFSDEVVIERDGQAVVLHGLNSDDDSTTTIDGLGTLLQAGENRLRIRSTNGNSTPYVLDVRYRLPRAPSDPASDLRLETRLNHARLREGQTVALDVNLKNVSNDEQPLVIAILGLPAGLRVPPGQLEELEKSSLVDHFELGSREVACYLRSLAPREERSFRLELEAYVPGRYTGPASRAFPIHARRLATWAEPLSIEIER